ncbi:MAG: hypothetical protein ACT4O0_12415 [Pseudonocardia sp.]
MTRPIRPSATGDVPADGSADVPADVSAAVPTQRILPGGPLARRRDVRGRFSATGRSPAPAETVDRSAEQHVGYGGAPAQAAPTDGARYPNEWRELSTAADPLPELAAAATAVPGGLGAELVEDFIFAGQRWVAADAGPFGTPIGAQLALEQRGLGGTAAEQVRPSGGRRRREAVA